MKIITVLAAALALTAPAIAAPAPIAFQYFCRDNPSQCQATSPATVDLAQTLTLLHSINVSVNRAIRPRLDAVDQWTLNPEYGDCDDYVVSKRAALIAAGIPAGALRIAIGKTDGQAHAVLLALTDEGPYVLDNLIDEILPVARSGITISGYSGANPMDWHH